MLDHRYRALEGLTALEGSHPNHPSITALHPNHPSITTPHPTIGIWRVNEMNRGSASRDLSAPEERAVTDSSSVLTIIGTIASQAVLITALLYYFGWVYTHSFFEYFGVEPSLIGYSTADYVLRSINVTFQPFVYLIFTTLLLFGFHRFVIAPALMKVPHDAPSQLCATANETSGPTVRRLGLLSVRRAVSALQAVAVIFMMTTLAGILFPGRIGVPLGLILPLLLMLSVGLLGYGSHIYSRYPSAFTPKEQVWPIPHSRMYTLTLLAFGLISGLWAVSLYGDHVGTRAAIDFAAQLPTRPGVVIYSVEKIALSGPGIDVEEIRDPGTKYHYQYTGLRFLVHSADKFLLLPSGWQHDRDRIFFVRDEDSIRIDIAAR